MMKRFLIYFLVVSLGAVCSLLADENVRAVQSRLKAGGFYFGEVNGRYDSDTAAAVTRYQIRNGLQITGKLDASTRHALGVTAGESEVPTPKLGENVWRYLRKSDQAYISRLIAEDARAAKRSKSPAPPVATRPPASSSLLANYNRDRLRDYVAAFVLAGLDPQVGSETEFFADRVDYFGERSVTREKVRRDLQRYNNRWPERKFWLEGDLVVSPIKDKIKVSFPLRYDLRSGSKRTSGKVWKTLVLEKTGTDDFQIVGVNERKA
jgi:peptidoglycan hydrolase-like protein with peptidoglycan-binding domain